MYGKARVNARHFVVAMAVFNFQSLFQPLPPFIREQLLELISVSFQISMAMLADFGANVFDSTGKALQAVGRCSCTSIPADTQRHLARPLKWPRRYPYTLDSPAHPP